MNEQFTWCLNYQIKVSTLAEVEGLNLKEWLSQPTKEQDVCFLKRKKVFNENNNNNDNIDNNINNH